MANLLELIKSYDDFREQAQPAKEAEARGPAAEPPSEDEPQGTEFLGLTAVSSPPASSETTAPPGMPAPPAMATPSPPGPPSVAPEPPPIAAGPPPASPEPSPEPAALEPVAPPTPMEAPAEPVMPPPTEPAPTISLDESTRPAVGDQALIAEADGLYKQALLSVSRMFEAAVMESIAPGRLLSTVRELEELTPLIVESTGASRGLLRRAMGTYAEGEGFVLPHSVNVAILAVELGRELDFERPSLLNLCLAGFAHDVGSVRLPQGLLTKSESLTPSEWDAMRSRPTHSYEALRNLGERYHEIAEIAHQVYERLDGSGYPKGLQGDEILPEARILGTVDFFESFAHPRPYKTTLPGTANHGIQMLMQMADKFGSATLKALVGSIGLFPIGSYVRLSSGEIGRVVDVKKENPMRPEVEVLLNSERRPPRNPRTLDLLNIPHIYVSRALTASDLRELGLLPPPSEMPAITKIEAGS